MKTEADVYLHLHFNGNWGFDGDVWIFPDDRVRKRLVKFPSGEVEKESERRKPGAFQRIVSLADEQGAWGMTTESLQEDLKANGGEPLRIMDSSFTTLDFKLPDMRLKAGLYAADSHAEHYPGAKSVSAFARLEREMDEVASDQ